MASSKANLFGWIILLLVALLALLIVYWGAIVAALTSIGVSAGLSMGVAITIAVGLVVGIVTLMVCEPGWFLAIVDNIMEAVEKILTTTGRAVGTATAALARPLAPWLLGGAAVLGCYFILKD